MATTTSTRPPSTAAFKPPRAPSLSSPSPSLGSKRPPSNPPPTTTANGVPNGINGTVVTPKLNKVQKRDSIKISQQRAANRGGATDVEAPRGVKRKLEPFVRTTDYILRKFSGRAPSLIVHLHQTHWRFDQQDGSFGYQSPMKTFLEHLRSQTAPHEMLDELLRSGVQFYDGCLIVEVHNHRVVSHIHHHKSSTTSSSAGKNEPFSIHNYNQHVVPSPYVPYPTPPHDSATKDDSTKEEPTDEIGAKPMLPTPSQDKSQKKHSVYTTVMHPTELSKHVELAMLLESSGAKEAKFKARQAQLAAQAAANGSQANGTTAAGNAASKQNKRARNAIEEGDIHAFQAEWLVRSEPPLLLEPAKSFDDARAIMKFLTHPLHDKPPIRSEGRKKTTAELAADEAQLADDERLALVMDERLQPSLGNDAADATVAAEGQNIVKGFEPDFARFKKFEEIKKRLDELKEQKRAEEEVERANKRAQSEQMERRKQEEERQRQAQQQQQQQAQQQQHAHLRMQQERAMAAQAAQAAAASGLSPNPQMVQQMQQMLRTQQNAAAHAAQQGSPVVRNHTPAHSSPLVGNVMSSFAQQSVPLSAGMPPQSAGSPPRPGSAMQVNQIGAANMARQVSQQPSQHGQSQAGTPRMPSATPQMANAIPRHMTPQPNMAGSPVPNNMQSTPMVNQNMMGTPQMHGLTPQQIAFMQQQRRSAAVAAAAAQNTNMQSPMPGSFGNQIATGQGNLMQNGQQLNGQSMMMNMQNAAMGSRPQMNAAQQMAYKQQMQQQMQQQQLQQLQQMQMFQGKAQPQQRPNGMPPNFNGAMPNGLAAGQNQPHQQSQAAQLMQSNQALLMQQQQFAAAQRAQQGQGQPQQQQPGGMQGQMLPQQNNEAAMLTNAIRGIMARMSPEQREQFNQNIPKLRQKFYQDLQKETGGELPPNAPIRFQKYLWQNLARGSGQPGAAQGMNGMNGMTAMNPQQQSNMMQQQQQHAALLQQQQMQHQQQQQRAAQMQQMGNTPGNNLQQMQQQQQQNQLYKENLARQQRLIQQAQAQQQMMRMQQQQQQMQQQAQGGQPGQGQAVNGMNGMNGMQG